MKKSNKINKLTISLNRFRGFFRVKPIITYGLGMKKVLIGDSVKLNLVTQTIKTRQQSFLKVYMLLLLTRKHIHKEVTQWQK